MLDFVKQWLGRLDVEVGLDDLLDVAEVVAIAASSGMKPQEAVFFGLLQVLYADEIASHKQTELENATSPEETVTICLQGLAERIG